MSSVHFVSSTDCNVPRSLYDEAWLRCDAWRGSLGQRWGVRLLHVHAGISLVQNGCCVSYSWGNRGIWRGRRDQRRRSEWRGRRVGDGGGGGRLWNFFNGGKRRSPAGHRHGGTIDLSIESCWPGWKVLSARGRRCSQGHGVSL